MFEQVVIERHRARHAGVERRVRDEARQDRELQASLASLREYSADWPDVDAFWLGEAYQRALDVVAGATRGGRSRRSKGVFYTPRSLVDYLIERVYAENGERWEHSLPAVLDPACGCGGFLVGFARYARAHGWNGRCRELAQVLQGADIDPIAVSLCRLGLWLEFGDPGDPADTPDRFAHQIRVADSLLEPPVPESFDLVIGNPPFLSQLASGTARSAQRTAALRARFGRALRPYTDPAALFFRLAVDTVGPGGAVGMVLPVSVLGSRDAEAIRSEVSSAASVRSLWLDTTGVFDAAVHAVAVTLSRDSPRTEEVSRFVGERFTPAPSCCVPRDGACTWAQLAAGLLGVPEVRMPIQGGHVLGDLCEITAGFRDEYYAIAAQIVDAPATVGAGEEDDPVRRVATVGMLDPARVAWGTRHFKIAGERWARPSVPVKSAGALLARLIDRQSMPKLLLATQTRVLEVAADPEGRYVALTPVIVVTPKDAADLWWIGALLSSPAVSAWVAGRIFGTARSLSAIKPSAALLRKIPVPEASDSWWRAGAHYRRATFAPDSIQRQRALFESARETLRGHGLAGPSAAAVLNWWAARLPCPPSADTTAPGV